MSSEEKILKELKDIKHKIKKFKVTQEVKVENILNLEDLRQSDLFDLSGIEALIDEVGAKLDKLGFDLAESLRSVPEPSGLVKSTDENFPPPQNISTSFADINGELQKLSAMLESIVSGLEVVRHELSTKSIQTDGPVFYTSGPKLRSPRTKNLHVKILNNSDIVHKVQITLFNLEQSPKEEAAQRVVTVSPRCSELQTFAIRSMDLDLQEFEVVFEFLNGDTQNVSTLVFGTKGMSSEAITEYVCQHQDLLPLSFLKQKTSSE